MRLFLAVFPPREVQQAALALGEALKRPGDSVSWVKVDNLHYTLRFIGEVGEDGARRVGEAARQAVVGKGSFSAALGRLGAFPNPRRARVLWVDLSQGAEPLIQVARDTELALKRSGFDPADKGFSAHLTLGRVRVPGDDWTSRLAAVPLPAPAPRFMVDRLSVVQSTLSPKGSTYRILEEAALAG